MTLKQMLFSAWDKYEDLQNIEKRKRRIYGVIIVVITLILFISVCLLFPQIMLESPLSSIAFVIIFTMIWVIWRMEWKKKRQCRGILREAPFEPMKSLIAVICPYCNNTFQIPQQNKPFKVKCPSCAKESLFR
jgi:ribosomal protein S27E